MNTYLNLLPAPERAVPGLLLERRSGKAGRLTYLRATPFPTGNQQLAADNFLRG
jgi:hypothetical protein